MNALMADQMPLCIPSVGGSPEPTFVLDVDGRVFARSMAVTDSKPIPLLQEVVSVRETEHHPGPFSMSLTDLLAPVTKPKWFADEGPVFLAYPNRSIRQYKWRYLDQETILSKSEAIDVLASLMEGGGPDDDELSALNLWYAHEDKILWSCHSGLSLVDGKVQVHKNSTYKLVNIDEVIHEVHE